MEALSETIKSVFIFAMIGFTLIVLGVSAAAGAVLAIPVALFSHNLWLIAAGAGIATVGMSIYLSVSVFGWRLPRF